MDLPDNHEKLIPVSEVVKRAEAAGFYFGFGDPYNRLRYYTKIGLLPHMVRQDDGSGNVVGHYPEWVLGRLIEIQRLKKEEGLGNEEVLKKLQVDSPSWKGNDARFVESETSGVSEIQPKDEGEVEPRGYAGQKTPIPALALVTSLCAFVLAILGSFVIISHRREPVSVTEKPETLGQTTVVKEITREKESSGVSGSAGMIIAGPLDNVAATLRVASDGRGTASQLQYALYPFYPGGADLGTSRNYWERVFAGGINLDGHGSLELTGDLRTSSIYPREDLVIEATDSNSRLDIQMALKNTGPYHSGQVYVDDAFGVGGIMEVGGNATFFADVDVRGNFDVSGNQTLTGNQTITGNLTVRGNTALGNAATDTTNIHGVTKIGDGGTTNYTQFTATGDLAFYGLADTITGPSTDLFTITNAGDLTISATGVGNDLLFSAADEIDLTAASLIDINTSIVDIDATSEVQIDGALVDIGSGTYLYADGDNDLGVAGDLEVLGTLYTAGISLGDNITLGDDHWIGLGAAGGRVEFDDLATDEVNILDANVGIGTTNPTQKLHVEGQCVTGDTLLKRKRRRRRADGTWEEYWEDVRIDEVQPGDEIQTLDEVTGALVVSTVAKLMDMGKKDIIKLTTASGKTIRTTANHPYLIKMKEARKPKIGVFYDAANMYFAGKQAGWKLDLNKLRATLAKVADLSFFNLYVAMPRKEDADYRGTLNFLSKAGKGIDIKKKDLKYIKVAGELVRKGDVDVEIVLDVVRAVDDLDLVMIVSGDSDFMELARYVINDKKKQIVFAGYEQNMAWELRKMRHLYLNRNFVRPYVELGKQKAPSYSLGVTLTDLLYQDTASLSRGKWEKVKGVRVGDRIAVTGKFNRAVFEEVTKIEHLSAEEVYDIEVEGTHNFVGNGIIAHNTYISSNTEVGGTLKVGSAATNNDDYIYLDDGVNEYLSWVDASSRFKFSADLEVNGDLILENDEYISNVTDDTFLFQGAGGADNTDLILNLDGTYPSIRSNTDNTFGIGENLYVYYYGGGSQAKLYTFGPSNGASAYTSLYHNDTDGYIDTGTGDLILQPSSTYVGINNTAPSYALDVTGSERLSGNLLLGTATTNGDDYIYFDDGSSEYLMWDESPGQFVLTDDLVAATNNAQTLGSISFATPVTGSDANPILNGTSDSGWFGKAVASGDVNGDGIKDLIVGAYAASDTGSSRGRAYIFYGSSSFSPSIDAENANVIINGTNDSDYFGDAATSADVNGDGFSDIIIAAYLAEDAGSNRGRVYIFYGSASLASSINAEDANVIINGTTDGDMISAGGALSSAGDINGDGFSDIVVGAYITEDAGTNRGRAYVFYGGSSLASSIDAENANVIINGTTDSDYLGVSVSSNGDLNGDGFSDIVVGAYGAEDEGTNRGRAYIIYGSATLSSSIDAENANVILNGVADSDFFGQVTSSSGDVNGDGYDDFAIASPRAHAAGTDRGTVYLFYGSPNLSASINAENANVVITGIHDNIFLGASLFLAEDINGDGYKDIAVGEVDTNVGSLTGYYYLFYGSSSLSSSLTASNADVAISETASHIYGYFGASSFLADITGDGHSEIIIGARGLSDTGTYRGRVFVYSPTVNQFSSIYARSLKAGLAMEVGDLYLSDTGLLSGGNPFKVVTPNWSISQEGLSAFQDVTIGDNLKVGQAAYFSGNVGIGTTLPDSKLHVVGGDLYVASDSPAFGNPSANEDLYVAGNMEVDGQCVTGDTALPIARVQSSKCKVQSCSSKLKVEEIEYKQIKDIRGGEYVLSLNEQTGQIEPHQIKGLLDMGVKPVFKLTTEDGRTIRTTGNHPYLLREKSLEESEINQEENNQEKQRSDKDFQIQISNIDFGTFGFVAHHNDVPLNLNAISRNTIPASKSNVKTAYLSGDFWREKLGTIKAAPSQPAAKLTNSSESIVSQTGLVITNNLSEGNFPVNGTWTKVVYLKSGMEIAVSDGQTVAWQKITSIEPVGYEQVYDIEVEGTHNFVANGIIAHNTYLGAITATGNILPATADLYNLGGTSNEWNAIYLGDDAGVYFGVDQDFSLLYDETTHDRLEMVGSAYDIDLSGAYSLDSDSTLTLGGTRLIYASDLAAAQGVTEAISLKSSVDLGATDELFQVGDSAADMLTILGNGYVGIGTTAPAKALDMLGNVPYTGYGTYGISVKNNWGPAAVQIDGGTKTDAGVAGATRTAAVDFKSGGTLRWGIGIHPEDNSNTGFKIWESQASDAVRFMIDAGGNVGIGSTSPDSKLHVVGGDLYVAADTGYTFDNASASGDLYVQGNLEVDGTLYGASVSYSGNITMAEDTWIGIGATTERLAFDGSGDVLGVYDAGLRIYDATDADYINIAHDGTDVNITTNGTGEINLDNDLDLALTLKVGTATTNGDDYIYFDDGSSEYLMWDETPGQFAISDDLAVTDSLSLNGAAIDSAKGLNVSYTDEGAISYGLYTTMNTNNYDIYGVYNAGTVDTNGETGYGVYNTINASAGATATGYGTYNSLSAGGAMYGTYNDISTTIAGNNSYGTYNAMVVGGTSSDAYGTYNAINISAANAQDGYGNYVSLRTATTDNAWGFYVDDGAGSSSAGTQYGVYVDLDDADTTNFSLYVESGSGVSYLGSDTGIGTSAPDARLHVVGGDLYVAEDTGYTFNNPSAGDDLYVQGNIEADGIAYFPTVSVGSSVTNNDDYIYFDDGSSEYLMWDESPGQFVLSDDFVPNANDTLNLGAANMRWADLYLGAGTIHIGTTNTDEYTIGYDTTANRLEFNVNGTGNAEIVMDSGGNVGIGTTTPLAMLDVHGTFENGLVGWWPLDNNTNDKSIGGHNGTLVASACPTGYILVPGNATYGTSDFCVMAYEAKSVGGVATSQALITPWASITQTAAITACTAAGGSHLITNNEWMTIARNVELVATNWTGGVGVGCMYRGNNGTDGGDNCGYNGSDPEFGTGRNAKASLTLSNGQVIWDFAGNVWEWTNNSITCAADACTTAEMPYDATPGEEWVEFPNLSTYGVLSYDLIRPLGSYSSTQGVGQIYTDNTIASPSGRVHAFLRGGYWVIGADGGAFALVLAYAPALSAAGVGFRCVR